MKKEYSGEMEIVIRFKNDFYTEDGEKNIYCKDYIADLKAKNTPLRTWIDRIWSVVDNDIALEIETSSHTYKYLKEEISGHTLQKTKEGK